MHIILRDERFMSLHGAHEGLAEKGGSLLEIGR